jgi:predicted hydrocarbon binding protein
MMKEFLPVEKKRKLVVLNSIFMKIQKTLEDSLGQSAAKVLYSAGKEFGIKYMEIVQIENKEAAIQDLLAELEVTGFVAATFDSDDLHFEVFNSPIAATYESSEVPVCHFLAGFFEGLVVEHYKKEDIVYKEISCKGCGDDVCIFELVNVTT